MSSSSELKDAFSKSISTNGSKHALTGNDFSFLIFDAEKCADSVSFDFGFTYLEFDETQINND